MKVFSLLILVNFLLLELNAQSKYVYTHPADFPEDLTDVHLAKACYDSYGNLRCKVMHSVIFYGKSGMPGHAYVRFFAWGHWQCCSQEGLDEAYGMYPDKKTSKVLIGSVPGNIEKEISDDSDVRLRVAVSKDIFVRCLNVKERWEGRNYKLMESDCVSFVISVAEHIGLNIPSRKGLDNLPARYIQALRNAN